MNMKPPSLGLLSIWFVDALCQFADGFIDGAWVGTGAGGVVAAKTDTTNVETITWNAVLGFAVACSARGLERVVHWHKTNSIPNPFRTYAPHPPNPVVPTP